MRQIRARDITFSLIAAAAGVVLALELKTRWPVLPVAVAYGPTVAAALGLYIYGQGTVEGLYALPFAVAYAIAYQLTPDLSVSLLVLRYLGGGTVSLERIKMHQGRVIKAGFLKVKSKPVELKGTIFNCIVHGMRKIGTAILVPAVNVKEEGGVIRIESDRDLAAAIESGTVARLRHKLEELMQENMRLRYTAGAEAIERLRKLSTQ